MNDSMLINKACSAMKYSYAPYSNFNVGAALLCDNGEIFCGANIENASYGAAICAERSAVAAAVSSGKTKFTALAVVGGKNGEINDYCYPCGICRQVLNEFCTGDFPILLFDGNETKRYSFGELLPNAFGGGTGCGRK